MRIKTFQSLSIKETLRDNVITKYHNELLDSEIYFKNRKRNFNIKDILNQYSKFIIEDILVKNYKPCLYIHEESNTEYTIRSILTCVDILDSLKEKVIKHEQIYKEKIENMCSCFTECPVQSEPIMLFYTESHEFIDNLIDEVIEKQKETYSFVSINNKKHRYWRIENNDTINKFIEIFNKIGSLYVADGHHRLCSLENLYNMTDNIDIQTNFNKVFANIVSASQIKTIRFSREWKIRATDNINKQKESFLEALNKYFYVYSDFNNEYDSDENTIMKFCDEIFYLKRNKSNMKEVKGCSAEIFQKYIEPLMNSCFDCCREIEPSINNDIENDNLNRITFNFSSPSIDEIILLCKKGYKFPRKTTFFYPKIEDGVIFCV